MNSIFKFKVFIKEFVKALDKDYDAINFLKTKFPKRSSAKVSEDVLSDTVEATAPPSILL